jgi:hypothetical protein
MCPYLNNPDDETEEVGVLITLLQFALAVSAMILGSFLLLITFPFSLPVVFWLWFKYGGE